MAPSAWKDEISTVALAGACAINTWFCTNCLIDYSADVWALSSEPAEPDRLLFLRNYYSWRGWAPFVTPIFLLLTVPLPILVFNLSRELLASTFGWRRASPLRHLSDVVQALTLIGVILPIGVPAVGRVQGAVIEACAVNKRGKLATPADCQTRAEELLPVHLLMLILNLVMFFCDIAKSTGNRGAAATKDKAS